MQANVFTNENDGSCVLKHMHTHILYVQLSFLSVEMPFGPEHRGQLDMFSMFMFLQFKCVHGAIEAFLFDHGTKHVRKCQLSR